MKTQLILITSLLSFSMNAQVWFDKSCENINEDVIEEEFKTSNERNILKIIINQAGQIEINDEAKENLNEIAFKELVLDFVTNPKGDKNKADKPEKVFIQMKSFNNESIKLDDLKSYVQEVYLYLWDKEAIEKYNSTYVDLNCKKREKVFNEFPLKLITTFEKKMSGNTTMRRGPSLPPFSGDVKKN